LTSEDGFGKAVASRIAAERRSDADRLGEHETEDTMAWRSVLTLGFLGLAGSAVALACSTTAGSDNDGGVIVDTGGTAGTGGTTSTGGADAGGTTATGGTGTGGTTDSCAAATTDNTCDTCVKSKCCAEYSACTDACATEFPCIQQCLIAGFAGTDGGSMDLATCAAQCQSADGGGTVADSTNELISCIDSPPAGVTDAGAGTGACGLECFGGAVN
jgi:hypothetical protein